VASRQVSRPDPTGISRVANDIDSHPIDFWDVLKSPSQVAVLKQRLLMTPCSKVEFDRSKNGYYAGSQVDRAAGFFIRNRQSRQGLGRDFATIVRNRTRRGMNELPSAWFSAIDGLQDVHQHLRSVAILNDDAIKVIKQQDGPRTLFYCDPPYLHSTRSTTKEYGTHEMTDADHRRLLSVLASLEGRFILSGYHNSMYDSFAASHGWRCLEMEIDNKASSAKTKEKMIECLWLNFEVA